MGGGGARSHAAPPNNARFSPRPAKKIYALAHLPFISGSPNGARLTSDELQYHFQDKHVFEIDPLPDDEAGPLHSL